METQLIDARDLIQSLKESHRSMLDFVESLSADQRLQPGTCGVWSVKDVLAHLLLWESETIKLLFQARQGIKPSTVHLKKTALMSRIPSGMNSSRIVPLTECGVIIKSSAIKPSAELRNIQRRN